MKHTVRRLNWLGELNRAKRYLEIGVARGLTFTEVDFDHMEAVDPNFRFQYQQLESATRKFFQITSDEYFGRFGDERAQSFDLVFIDGLHTFEQTARDLLNVLQCTHRHSIILIDDTVPVDIYSAERSSARARLLRAHAGLDKAAWHGDVYKVVFFIHDFLPGLSYATIDRPGNPQTVVWRKFRQDFEPLFDDMERISRLSFGDLHEHAEILRLSDEESVQRALAREFASFA